MFWARFTILSTLALMVAVPTSAGLIAYYPFEGNANDLSGNSLHGTIIGSLTTVAGYQGQAFSFDGNNNSVSVPVNINPGVLPQVTFGAWVKAGAVGQIRGIISHDTGGFDRTLDIDSRGPGDWQWCAFTGSGVLCGPEVALNTWTFLAVRYDQNAETVVLTVNGTHYAGSGTPGSGESSTRIGRNPNFDLPFVGVIDSVFFYNEILTDEQLASIRDNGVPVIIPEPGTWLLAGAGLLGLFGLRRRR